MASLNGTLGDKTVTLGPNDNGVVPEQEYRRPKITTGTSEEYRQRLAEISSRATVSDPLNILFERDKVGGAPIEVEPSTLYRSSLKRLEVKVAAGAVIVEAANFAAAACWQPPSAVPDPLSEAEIVQMEKERPVFANFVRQSQGILNNYLGTKQKPYLLTLMARDPNRKDKGAVRAVIEPFVEKAKQEGVPLWLIAGNQRARDVYGWLGFREVQVFYSYPHPRKPQDEGIPSWCMVANYPPESPS
ncbi:hypothetical protein PV10_02393 [Exophiala mesophila]|uniref:N-acetyltransferase domain-containing protein n=1 Tax=Exophiala mesophila TaxID=212818 RepID=A0A0D2A6M6_EXOME|nr:uncharacterized protein PV10_02393 [Exophiala mesophila]KIV94648.1 hypothetical protein PV10_02393 [Exophiala mesophila]